MLVLVTDAFGGRGGIAQYNRDFLEAVAKHPRAGRIEVLPRIAPDPVGPLPDKIYQHPAVRGRAAFALEATRRALAGSYDLIYNGHLYLGPLSALLSRITRTPMLSQLHGTEIWTRPTWIQRKALERSSAVLCVSRDTRARTLAAIGIEPERLTVLPNTVRMAYRIGDREKARARFGLDHRRALLTVARLDVNDCYKGHLDVVDALPALLARDSDLVYLVAGEGNDRERLESYVAAKGLSAWVRFMGYVPPDDLPDLYRAADVFVMPSTGEGFGIAYLEAMSCGTPAVGLAVGGAADALGDGLLGHVTTIAALPDTIWHALDARVDRQALSDAVSIRFGPAVFSRQLHAILQTWFGSAEPAGDKAA